MSCPEARTGDGDVGGGDDDDGGGRGLKWCPVAEGQS